MITIDLFVVTIQQNEDVWAFACKDYIDISRTLYVMGLDIPYHKIQDIEELKIPEKNLIIKIKKQRLKYD